MQKWITNCNNAPECIEATFKIDDENDKLIQDVLYNKFFYSTVLTIANHFSTLENSDKILVLGKG